MGVLLERLGNHRPAVYGVAVDVCVALGIALAVSFIL